MAQFFIRRPIVAIVIAILTVMLGLVTITGLSVEQYPFLAPPNIRVTATYPGASAEAVEQSVATPVEQEVNGVDRLIYMKSSNTSDGRMQLDVNFEVGTDQDIANVLTQNRVSAAQAWSWIITVVPGIAASMRCASPTRERSHTSTPGGIARLV